MAGPSALARWWRRVTDRIGDWIDWLISRLHLGAVTGNMVAYVLIGVAVVLLALWLWRSLAGRTRQLELEFEPAEPVRDARGWVAEALAAAERGEYRTYRSILRLVLEGLGARLGFIPTASELDRFSTSVRDWPAFPDSASALRALHKKYRLAIISNVDDDLFAYSAERLQVTFDWIITAGAESFTAHLSGVLNTQTGAVVMNGTVVDGFLRGAQVHEVGQLVNPAALGFEGTISVMPSTA